MKRVAVLILVVLLLTGCVRNADEIDCAMLFREKLQQSQGCSFNAIITADYRDAIHTFTMHCQTDTSGSMAFNVSDPETIRGISGKVMEGGGAIIFDQQILAFDLLADGQITPVSAPWLVIQALRGGYLRSCCFEDDMLRISVDDSYQANALQVDVWIGPNDTLQHGEILWNGRRIVSFDVRDFVFV